MALADLKGLNPIFQNCFIDTIQVCQGMTYFLKSSQLTAWKAVSLESSPGLGDWVLVFSGIDEAWIIAILKRSPCVQDNIRLDNFKWVSSILRQ